MRDTYSKLTYHLVFSIKNRIPLIGETFRDALYGYIGGILRGNKGVLLAAGGMPDHVHRNTIGRGRSARSSWSCSTGTGSNTTPPISMHGWNEGAAL